jgi:hypothetical protein
MFWDIWGLQKLFYQKWICHQSRTKTLTKTHIAKQSKIYPNHRLLVHNLHTTKQKKKEKKFSSAARIGLRRHLQFALQCLSCPQSNIHGLAGLIISGPIYARLTTTPFRVPNDPGPVAIYYPPPVAIRDIGGNSILDANGNPTFVTQPPIGCPEQATIDDRFNRVCNYYLSYLNIRCASYNVLDNNIDDAFKVLDNLALVG